MKGAEKNKNGSQNRKRAKKEVPEGIGTR